MTAAPFRVLVGGPEKTGTNLAARLLNRLGYRYSKHGPSTFIAERPDETFGMDADAFLKGPRVRIWGWPTAGLPQTLVREELARVEPGEFCHCHAPFSPELCAILADLDYRVVQTVRDPRDQVQSMADWFASEHAPDNLRRRELGQLSYAERIRVAIAGGRLSNGAGVSGVGKTYEDMLGWHGQPIVKVIRFEDLVGPKGGGNAGGQFETVSGCAGWLGRSLSDARVAALADELFGFSVTFRRGKIGAWRDAFTPELIALFKEHANWLLLRLRYETGLDWW